MADAPRYRSGPCRARVRLVAGLVVTATAGDPVGLPAVSRPAGWVPVGMFAVWNGWGLALMGRARTGLLPGVATTRLLARGPFRVSRNPLYLGLIALDAGIALLWPSFWALLFVPLGVLALTWGAILPEERHLRAVFGAGYEDYVRRVRRWL